jgi:phosphoglycolate phosphatase
MNPTNTVSTVVFDWNGTLLNDVVLAVKCVNQLRASRAYERITVSEYRDLFELPIQRFYSKLGLADHCGNFNSSMREYLQYYSSESPKCSLHLRAKEMLNQLKSDRMQVAILSASSQVDLDVAMKNRKLTEYFDFVVGKQDTDAGCKKREAEQLSQLLRVAPGHVLYIGDTVHDAEVAAAVGWQCILVENGHQSPIKFAESTQRIPTVSRVVDVLRIRGVLE